MALEPLIGTHKDAFAALPPIEWVLLLKSILQKKLEIPNAWKRLEIDLDTNAYAKPIWDSRMVSGAYQNAQERPIHELSPFSGLYMLKFVIGRVLLLERAKEWKKMPVWKVAMGRLIREGKILGDRDIITAGALSGAFWVLTGESVQPIHFTGNGWQTRTTYSATRKRGLTLWLCLWSS